MCLFGLSYRRPDDILLDLIMTPKYSEEPLQLHPSSATATEPNEKSVEVAVAFLCIDLLGTCTFSRTYSRLFLRNVSPLSFFKVKVSYGMECYLLKNVSRQ